MKKIIYLLSLIIIAFSGCNKDDDEIYSTTFNISVAEISANETSYIIGITNTRHATWTLTKDDASTWVKDFNTIVSSNELTSITIYLDANTELTEREATFYLEYINEGEERTSEFVLTQLGETIVATIGVDTLFVTPEKQQMQIEVNSNIEWEATASQSWVKFISTPAVRTITQTPLTFDFEENSNYNFRTAFVTFKQKDGDFCDTLMVYQSGIANLESDKLMLTELYNSTKGSNWTNKWDLTAPVNSWYGVTVALREGQERVVQLDLSENNLEGTIPVSIGNISYLEGLMLQENLLTGSIPSQIGGLAQLRYLYLYNNSLTGDIPSEIFNPQFINRVHLGGNQLGGEIPTTIADAEKLQIFGAENNNLIGNLPEKLGDTKNLETIYIQGNKLSGEIPANYLKNTIWKTWSPQIYICPQQSGFGFENCSID